MYRWLKDAGEQLEYRKNYEGYWDGEKFVEQVRVCYFAQHQINKMQVQIKNKIIPVFERLHGPDYQALTMVNNSQGHSAWPKDALHVQNMNLNPGSKVPHIHDGWFTHDGMQVL